MTSDRPSAPEDFSALWWLTLPELCTLLSIGPQVWDTWQAEGTAPTSTTGPDGVTRVHRADLAAWQDRMRSLSDSPWLNPAEARDALRTGVLRKPADKTRPSRWLTVPQICVELDITPEEWQQWRAEGNTPPHTVIDGTARVLRTDLDAWMKTLATTSPENPTDPDDETPL
jgi:hypothetical protein